jgi:3-oxoacyl-[acyl-carrier-protein] synthase III
MISNVEIASMARRMPSRSVRTDEPPFSDHAESAMLERFWGITSRFVIDQEAGECEIGLAEAAAREAMDLAGVLPSAIGLCLSNITAPAVNPGATAGAADRLAPRTSWNLARRLGLTAALTSDIEVECMSFLVQMQMAANFIAAGRAEAVLICSTERMSGVLDYRSKSSIPFGDGAVCAVLRRTEDSELGLVGSTYFSDPEHFELATVRWSDRGDGGVERPTFVMSEDGDRQLAELVPGAIPRVVVPFLQSQNLAIEDFDSVVLHQPSRFIFDAWTRRLRIPADRVLCNVQHNGCLVSGALPLALYDSIQAGVVAPGHLTLLGGLGAGWAFGAQIWRLGEIRISDDAPPKAIENAEELTSD